MSRLVENIKESEGFRPYPYKDSLGKDTVGYGTLLPLSVAEVEMVMRERFAVSLTTINDGGIIFQGMVFPLTKEEAEYILQFRLNQKISELVEKKPILFRFPQEKQEVLFEMGYQLGINGLLKFKMMWLALENFDYKVASEEMLDSKWKLQTPTRAEKLAKQMAV